MAQHKITPKEIKFLQEALSADYKTSNIRLREGEYQYNLAKAIALSLLELHFPDVKDIIKRLFGEEKTNDIQFIRKIQTILKKMEKSDILRILPKKNPWELQTYGLISFKFQDVDKNIVILATNEQIKQAHTMLSSLLNQQKAVKTEPSHLKIKTCILTFLVVASYIASAWVLMQPIINPTMFVPTFSISVAFSALLGKTLSQR